MRELITTKSAAIRAAAAAAALVQRIRARVCISLCGGSSGRAKYLIYFKWPIFAAKHTLFTGLIH